MNLKLFHKLMKQGAPNQHPPEWWMFLEICGIYLKRYKIKNPIVVELGIDKGGQKKFYEQLFGAEHIGIDKSGRRSIAEIIGNTHDSETLAILKEKLRGRPINILFIDADHHYEAVKEDYETYAPLCSDIVALHDIESQRLVNTQRRQVWRFWDELSTASFAEEKKHKPLMFIPIVQCYKKDKKVGIGMIIKK